MSGDFRTKCGRCGKRIRVPTGSKARRCFECARDDLLVKMERLAGSEAPR